MLLTQCCVMTRSWTQPEQHLVCFKYSSIKFLLCFLFRYDPLMSLFCNFTCHVSALCFFFFLPCYIPSQSLIKIFLLFSDTIIPYPALPMYNLCPPLFLYPSLSLSIRGMSFNMPPVTSPSQEAHPSSHSPCPLFLNEGHMRCGQHWS